ncbi:LLM class flavin-dependent oxidoreductase [Jiangella ureilytica]|uniref:LLM class flavin-dependent oxidoreductase n=1 Tax=Jiangella ureilytica TaxID=2530374 RepID=A0A4V2XXT0_9ACTN|nr:LLM class flavin-dependent oxidoreductase [Jiangella ureilytica]TDC54555.1 LLM class flavin-dependent oxidoreductase [Jiangella ureilytica]
MTEPSDLIDLGVAAEDAGWDGAFLWDHVYGSPAAPMPVADTWTVLAALAVSTRRITIGPMVTPLARRRPHKVARETVTVDRLCGGRLVLGVGLGNPAEEFTAFGEDAVARTRAERLDEALETLVELWSGTRVDHEGPHVTVRDAQFLPTPVNGTVPVWVAATVSHPAPARRAARHDGIVLTDPNAESGIGTVTPAAVREACETVTGSRGDLHDFDVALICPDVPSADDAAAYEHAGVTWIIVTGWLDQLRDTISAGPPA